MGSRLEKITNGQPQTVAAEEVIQPGTEQTLVSVDVSSQSLVPEAMRGKIAEVFRTYYLEPEPKVWVTLESIKMTLKRLLPPAAVEPVDAEVTVETEWDGSFLYRVPSDVAQELATWNQYTVDGHSLVDIVAGYAGIGQEDAALWLSAAHMYYLNNSGVEDESILNNSGFLAIVTQAMVEGRLEVAGNLSAHQGEEIDFYYREPSGNAF